MPTTVQPRAAPKSIYAYQWRSGDGKKGQTGRTRGRKRRRTDGHRGRNGGGKEKREMTAWTTEGWMGERNGGRADRMMMDGRTVGLGKEWETDGRRTVNERMAVEERSSDGRERTHAGESFGTMGGTDGKEDKSEGTRRKGGRENRWKGGREGRRHIGRKEGDDEMCGE